MNLENVKDALYDMTALFFQGADVIWTEQINTKPKVPYITIHTGSIRRTAFPIIDDDGRRFYPCQVTAEWNLYTKGKAVTIKDGSTGNYSNTAVSDLMDFFNFAESEEITDRMAEKGIEVTLSPPVRDLTGLQNDSRYRYRAMAEAVVTWSQEADGLYGIGGMPLVPDSSGGGTPEMAERSAETIEEIEISELTEGGTDYDEK